MKKRKKSKKSISAIKVLYKWFQLSIDQALTILVWVLMWSLIEPYVADINTVTRILIVLMLVIILQRDILTIIKQKKIRR
jgi:hypothetical protein